MTGQTKVFYELMLSYLIKDEFIILSDSKYNKFTKDDLILKMGYEMSYINTMLLKLRGCKMVDNCTVMHKGKSNIYVRLLKGVLW